MEREAIGLGNHNLNHVGGILQSRLTYLSAEAFKGLARHRAAIIPSLATAFLCSFLLIASLSALSLAISASARSAALYRAEAFFAEPPSQEQADSIVRAIAGMEGIASLAFVSEGDALSEFMKSFPEEMLYLIDGNPLPASLRIQASSGAQSAAGMQALCDRLQALPEISRALAPMDWIKRWEELKGRFFAIPVAASALMFCILWLIMQNSVRLELISRKELVENLKYTGASPFFMQFPFALEGLLQGLAGAGAAAALAAALQSSAARYFPLLAALAPSIKLASILVIAFVSLAQAAASIVTVRKFIARGI